MRIPADFHDPSAWDLSQVIDTLPPFASRESRWLFEKASAARNRGRFGEHARLARELKESLGKDRDKALMQKRAPASRLDFSQPPASGPHRERATDWEDVTSTWVRRVRWVWSPSPSPGGPDGDHLEVEFLSGFRCRYPGKGRLFDAFVAAGRPGLGESWRTSAGKFLHKHLYDQPYVPI